MKIKNIYTIDDYLIKAGWVLFIGFLFSIPVGGRWVLLWFSSSFLLLLVGYLIRSKENKVNAIWTIIQQVGDVSVVELANSTGLQRKFILNAVNIINLNSCEYYVHDPEQDRITDRQRVQSHTVSLTEQCDHCGGVSFLQMRTGQCIKPVCNYCGGAMSKAAADRIDSISVSQQLMSSQSTTSGLEKIKFSPGLFVLLLIVFPPGAVGYALVKMYRYYQWK